MDEVSNKTLATLLVVAIVISLAGTFFAMRGVSQVTSIITGAQTAIPASGTTKVNITETTSIYLNNNTVDFGTGYRNATVVDVNTECNLTTNATLAQTPCWINMTAYAPMPFLLENTGNNYVNVTINSSNATTFLSGTPTGSSPRRYQFVPVDMTPATVFARGENGCNNTFEITGWTEFNAGPQLICTNMSPYDGEDSFYVDVNISIPPGIIDNKVATVTFAAVKSAQ